MTSPDLKKITQPQAPTGPDAYPSQKDFRAPTKNVLALSRQPASRASLEIHCQCPPQYDGQCRCRQAATLFPPLALVLSRSLFFLLGGPQACHRRSQQSGRAELRSPRVRGCLPRVEQRGCDPKEPCNRHRTTRTLPATGGGAITTAAFRCARCTRRAANSASISLIPLSRSCTSAASSTASPRMPAGSSSVSTESTMLSSTLTRLRASLKVGSSRNCSCSRARIIS